MSGERKVPAPAGPRGAFKNSHKSRIYSFRTASALTLAMLAPLGLISIHEFEGIVAPPSPRLQSPGWEQEEQVQPCRFKLPSLDQGERVRHPPGEVKKRNKTNSHQTESSCCRGHFSQTLLQKRPRFHGATSWRRTLPVCRLFDQTHTSCRFRLPAPYLSIIQGFQGNRYLFVFQTHLRASGNVGSPL